VARELGIVAQLVQQCPHDLGGALGLDLRRVGLQEPVVLAVEVEGEPGLAQSRYLLTAARIPGQRRNRGD
jgi:hypothetical protein